MQYKGSDLGLVAGLMWRGPRTAGSRPSAALCPVWERISRSPRFSDNFICALSYCRERDLLNTKIKIISLTEFYITASFLRLLIRQKLSLGRHWGVTVHRPDRLTYCVTGDVFWGEPACLEGSYHPISICIPEITVTYLLLSCTESRSKLFYIAEFPEIWYNGSWTRFGIIVPDLLVCLFVFL